jgi:phage baseplate assembly protein V
MEGQKRTEELERLVSNLVRVGIVSSVNDAMGTCRVLFEDRDDLVSFELPVMQRQSLQNKDYCMPDIGEQVICLFLPSGVEQGFVIGSFYSSQESRPASSRDVRRVQFNDGTFVEYNRSTHDLVASVQGSANILATGEVVVTAPTIRLNGAVIINGSLNQGNGSAGGAATIAGPVTVTNDVVSGGVSLQNHTHSGVQSGGSNTGGPN